MAAFLIFLWVIGFLTIIHFDLLGLQTAYNNNGMSGIASIIFEEKYRYLPLIGSTIGTVGLFCYSGIKLRWMILVCSSLWLIHNLIAVSIGPSIMEVSFIVMNSIVIRKLYRERAFYERTRSGTKACN